jgi:hypothetical protein
MIYKIQNHVHWMSLALFKRPKSAGVSLHSFEDGNTFSARNVLFHGYLEFRTYAGLASYNKLTTLARIVALFVHFPVETLP